jgi:hypothetical protein
MVPIPGLNVDANARIEFANEAAYNSSKKTH